MEKVEQIAKLVSQMDKQLRNELIAENDEKQVKELWENTYIKKQVDKRKRNGTFTLSDHIRGMVYSMLTSGAPWNRIEPHIDGDTGQIRLIDEIFYEYHVDALLSADPVELSDRVRAYKLGTPYIKKQMKALIEVDIRKLLVLEKEYGSVDSFYKGLADKNDNLKTLVKKLSDAKSPHKFVQLGEALTAEYLKNVGYDVGKPDRHIRRILGCEYLGCSTRKTVPPFEAIDIIAAIAKELKITAAEVDYIIWAYCANGYGEICTKCKPQCHRCVAKDYCKRTQISDKDR